MNDKPENLIPLYKRGVPRRGRTMAEVLGVGDDAKVKDLSFEALDSRIDGILARRRTDPAFNEALKNNFAQQWRLDGKGAGALADHLNVALRQEPLEVNGLVALAEAYKAARLNKTE